MGPACSSRCSAHCLVLHATSLHVASPLALHLPIEFVLADGCQLGTEGDGVRILGAGVQAAFKAEQEAALKKAEVAKDLPGAFTDTVSPGVRTRSQARKML